MVKSDLPNIGSQPLVPVFQMSVGIISASENFCGSILSSRVQIQVGDTKIILAVIGEPGLGGFCHSKVFAGTKACRGESKVVSHLMNSQSLRHTFISVIIPQSDIHWNLTSRARTFANLDIKSGDAVCHNGEVTSDGVVQVVGPGGEGAIPVVSNLAGVKLNWVKVTASKRQVSCGSIGRICKEGQVIETSHICTPIFFIF